MKKILIFGYFGFNNFGDELLLISILNMIRKYSCESMVYALYNIKNRYKFLNNFGKNFHNVILISRWNFLLIIKVILYVDTVICTGGLFQDRTSGLSLFYYLMIIKLAKLFNKKVLVLGTEFDIKRENEKFLINILEKVDYLGVRNTTDLNRIIFLSKKIKVEFLPDLSFVFYERNFATNQNNKNILGIILKSPSKNYFEKEIKEVINFCEKIYKKYIIYLIPLHLGENMCSEDYVFSLKILDKVPKCCVKVWNNLEDVRNIFEEVKFFIVSRFHGIIMCLLLRKNFICVTNNLKLVNFLKDIGKENDVVSSYNKISISKIGEIKHKVIDDLEQKFLEYKGKLEEIFLNFQQSGWI